VTLLALSVDEHAHDHDFELFTTNLPDNMMVRRWAHAKGEDLVTLLDPNWDGALPATFAYSRGTQRAVFHGPLDDTTWRQRLQPLLATPAKNDADADNPGH